MDKDKCSKNGKTKRVSFVLPKDKEENLDTSTDMTGDLVIDIDRCDTTQDTIDRVWCKAKRLMILKKLLS